jgi:hypothetical protein
LVRPRLIIIVSGAVPDADATKRRREHEIYHSVIEQHHDTRSHYVVPGEGPA